jgi:type VI secretion system secreted protein VgrG
MATPRKITLKSPVDSDQLLIRSARITEQLGQLFEIQIDLLSPDESIDFNKLLGKEARIAVALDDGGSRYFHGHIVEFSQLGRLGTYATYQMRLVPWLWFLTRTADCRIFQSKSAPDIIKDVFRDLGFTDFKDTLTKSYRTRDYCVQYRETDFNFVQRLMEEEGIYYFFTHADSSHTLVLSDSSSGHEPMPNYDTIEYFPPSSNESREKDHIYDWHQSRNIQPGKCVVTDYDFTKPRAKLETQCVQKHEFPKTDYEVFDYPGGYALTAEGDHYARTRLESLQAQFERFNGVGNARGQAVGSLFKLAGYPRKDQNKQYLAVSATYELHAGEYESGTEAPKDFTVSFEAIDAKLPFRALITTRKPMVGGPQTATVVGPSGEEIYTDKYGRVKVQFHWDRYGKRDEKSSCWVRVSQIWAGKNWGWMSIPRMGQECVVDFLEGDPDQPLITGRVYNQDNLPPFDLPANKTQSGVRTRSTTGGSPDTCNEIRFEDKKGAEQLYIHAEKNQDISVEADESHSVGGSRNKTIGSNETTKVGVDRTENVGANEKITIGANRTENVGANETIAIAAARSENVGASETINIGASRSVTVGASETKTVATLRTHNVGINEMINIGAAQEVTIGGLQMVTVGAAQIVSVGAIQKISVGASQSTNVGTNLTTSAGGNEKHTIGGGRTSSVGKDDSQKVGQNLVIDAGDSVTIKTGSASITMKKDGTIEIKGKDIKIDGSGKVNVKASGNVAIKGTKTGIN